MVSGEDGGSYHGNTVCDRRDYVKNHFVVEVAVCEGWSASCSLEGVASEYEVIDGW